VADEDRPADSAFIEHGRQADQRLVVEIAFLAGKGEGFRVPVSPAVINKGRHARSFAQKRREIPPLTDTAKPLVQENEGRTVRLRVEDARFDPFGMKPVPGCVDPDGFPGNAHAQRFLSCETHPET